MAEADVIQLLRELNRVKVLFQARAVAAAIGVSPRPPLPRSIDPDGGI